MKKTASITATIGTNRIIANGNSGTDGEGLNVGLGEELGEEEGIGVGNGIGEGVGVGVGVRTGVG